MSQHGQILWSISTANARLIFAKGHIQHPMDPIFNVPVAGNRRSKALPIPTKAEQVIPSFSLYLLTDMPLRLHHANGLQALPFAVLIQIAQLLQIVNEPIFADFQTPMSLVNRFLKVGLNASKLLFLSQTKGIFDVLIQVAWFSSSAST